MQVPLAMKKENFKQLCDANPSWGVTQIRSYHESGIIEIHGILNRLVFEFLAKKGAELGSRLTKNRKVTSVKEHGYASYVFTIYF
jgi:hypothetical protein